MNAANECDAAENEIIVWVQMMISQFDCGYIKSESSELNIHIEEIKKLLKRRDEALKALHDWARSLNAA